jgi:hypothetical protein
MTYKYTTSYYIGLFIVSVIAIIVLLVLSPTQNSFFDLKEKYPILYYNLHENKYVYDNVISEIIMNTGISRIDYPIVENTNLNQIEWIDYSINEYPYIRGNVQILPLFYNNVFYNNCAYFPVLMQLLQIQPDIVNVFLWKLSSDSALLQHPQKKTDGNSNIHETNILDKNILRYTLAVNILSCMEEECSIWVDGQLRKLTFDKFVLWDPSKEFSLHNDTATDGDTIFLNIDIKATK